MKKILPIPSKAALRRLGAMLAAVAWVAPLRAAPPGPSIEIVSPSHPATFYVDGDCKLGQHLAWDDKAEMLKGKITYSIVMGAGDQLLDPANYRTFDLAFPTVQRSAHDELYIQSRHRKITIGRLEQSAFGTQVQANPGVHFIAHRVEGALGGEIIVSPAAGEKTVR